MIALDTSALVAMYLEEPGYQVLADIVARSKNPQISTTTFVEFIMLARIGGDRQGWLRDLLDAKRLHMLAFDEDMAIVAAEARERYGKGSGHPAQLNFGDCLSYAFARSRNIPLLFVGGDFAHTDITAAL